MRSLPAGKASTFQDKAHCSWDFNQQLASAHYEPGICITDTCGELTESTSIAGVGIGAKQNFPRAVVTLGGAMWQTPL